jgi:NAD+ kinase
VKIIGILFHPKVPATRTRAKDIETLIKHMGLKVWVCSAWDKEKACELIDGSDLLITVGGDGTILRAVQMVVPGPTPILGVNMGKLGFMTELSAAEALEKLPEALDGQAWIDERSMLQAKLVTAGNPPQTFHALNDVVLARGEIARLIRVETSVDGQRLTTFRADAVIAATATGSTGYSLAAGGPIIYPGSKDFLLTAVAPHLSLNFPLVLAESSEVSLKLDAYLSAAFSVDGHINLPLANRDVVTVRHSPHAARFLRLRPRGSFFSSLEEKLKGK